MKTKNRSLGKIFVAAFFILLIFPLAVVMALSLYNTFWSTKHNVNTRIALVSTSLVDSVKNKAEAPYGFLCSIAGAEEKSKSDNDGIHSMIESGLQNYNTLESLYILNAKKEVIYVTLGAYINYDKNDFLGITFSDIPDIAPGKSYWSQPRMSPVSNKNVIRIAVPFKGGYVVSDMTLSSFHDMIKEYASSGSSDIYLADQSGSIIASNQENFDTLNLNSHPLFNAKSEADNTTVNYAFKNQKIVGTIKRIDALNWYLIYEEPVANAFSNYSQIFGFTLTALTVLLVFSLIVMYFIRIKLIVPMKLLTERSEMIAMGTYAHFNTAEKGVFKELQALYDSFESMAITIDKREKELKNKEEYLRSVFDSTTNTGLLIISLEAEPAVTDANAGSLAIFGYRMSELLGLPAAALVKSLGNDLTIMCSESRKLGASISGRLEMTKKNGTIFPALCTVSPLFNFSGVIEGFITGVIDITEITKVQNELESEKERLDVTLKSIGEGVIAADKNGRVTLVNSSAENILGQKYRFLVGHSINDIIQVYDYDTGKLITDKVTEFSGKTNRTYRANMVTKDTGVITVYITSSAMTNATGEIIGSVYVFRDITERMKMEQELINRKKQLEEINKDLEKRVQDETEKRRKNEQMLFEQAKFAAMGQMISAIAHQWRQPLNALALYVQDIEDAHEMGEVDRIYLENFGKNAMKLIDHMSSTIDDFRNFFHSANTMESVDVVSVMLESLSLVTTQLRSQLINYKVTIKDNKNELIFENRIPEDYAPINNKKLLIFPSELKQVLLNILQNARYAISEFRKTTKDRIGSVDISITYKPDRVKIDISNDGGNIPDDILSRIFDPYFTTKPEGEGTGIGLYMSKIMIEDHMDGLLVVENIPNGAKFSITLGYHKA